MTDAYTQSVEKDNERLRQMLAETQLLTDRYTGNPLKISLTMMIAASLDQQKKLMQNGFGDAPAHERAIVRVGLPRQIGLSTSIVMAAAEFFTDIWVMHNVRYPTHAHGDHAVQHFSDVNALRGRRVQCVIVDPWSVRFGGAGYTVWDITQRAILDSLDTCGPHLLILAG